ncbi:hypothetical protein [Mycobacterium sp. IS-2888]|uniref:hypothetical protein n=1 Tax=Mycobacterium sp. IS-2888 TaxID=1834159 RepID=UPI0020CA1FB3|nr:hypothetical protein [Mycobacterium sp. IS-2888]
MGPPVPRISATANCVPAALHAAAAARNFPESALGQIIPMNGATHPQPAGGPSPVPTDEGGEPAEIGPVGRGAGSGLLWPETSDCASASE